MLFCGYISLLYLWRNQMLNTPMEPEKIEQSIFTACKQQRQGPEYHQSQGIETLTLQNENVIYTRNLVTVIIWILLHLEHCSPLTEMPRFHPWLANMGLIMISKNSPQARVALTQERRTYIDLAQVRLWTKYPWETKDKANSFQYKWSESTGFELGVK